jgi:hypothetical protein
MSSRFDRWLTKLSRSMPSPPPAQESKEAWWLEIDNDKPAGRLERRPDIGVDRWGVYKQIAYPNGILNAFASCVLLKMRFA